jgi:hypothetical protein
MHFIRSGLLVAALSLPMAAFAQTPSFKDVPANSSIFSAVEYLKARGIMQGYNDGTFKANNKVNRAEAVKLIVASIATAEQLAKHTKTSYGDVPADAWYLPYVEYAFKEAGIIDGPPKAAAFKGTDPVLKAQFFKMFFLANKIDINNMYSEIKLPLAMDAQNPSEWHYPFMRYAIASSMTMVQEDGMLSPGRELTRGDIAMLLYRYFMYVDGRRTQALLSEAESEIVNILKQLEEQEIDQAGYAAARSLIAARGALTSKPDEAIVKGAVKTAEGFQTLVLAYRAGAAKNYAEVIKLTGDAWHLAQKAQEFSPALSTVAQQMQTIAKNMADEARTLQAGGTPQ